MHLLPRLPVAGESQWLRRGWRLALGLLVVAVAQLPAAIWVPTYTQTTTGVGWYPAWVDGHYAQRWIPAHWEDRVVDGEWGSQWVEGHEESVWIDAFTNSVWIDGRWESVWVDGHTESQWTDGRWEDQWHDGYTDDEGNWVEGYMDSAWIDGSWSDVWVDGFSEDRWVDGGWETTEVPGHWETQWIDGYMEPIWVPEHTVPVWVEDSYANEWVDGQWTLVQGQWTVTITVEGHWEGEWTWSPFEYLGPWQPTGDWTPAESTIAAGTLFTQTRPADRPRYRAEINEAGDARGEVYDLEQGTLTRNSVGTGTATNPATNTGTGTGGTGTSGGGGGGGGGGGTPPGGGGGGGGTTLVRPTNVAVLGVPASAAPGATLTVSATATKGTYDLATHILYYSWNSTENWVQLAATPNADPANSIVSAPISPDRTGTLHFKATAWDTQNNSSTSPIVSVGIGGEVGDPNKRTPVGAFADQIVLNQGLLVVTPAMLDATFTDPVTHAPLQGTIIYTAVREKTGQVFSPFTPASINPGLTVFYGPLRVTATFLPTSTYNAASTTATFENRDNTPPPIPPNLRAALVGSTSFSVNWDEVVDQPTGIRAIYEVQLNDGPIATTPAPTRSFTGLAAGSTHSVRIRAKEALSGGPELLTSEWVNLTVALPASAPDPSSTPRWVDINGDGLRDEVIGGNTNKFNYVVSETSSTTVTYSSWTSTFVPVLFPYHDYYTEGLGWFVGGWWNDDETTTTETIATVRPEFQVMTEPGYDYAICRAVVNEQGQTVFRRVHTIPGTDRRLEIWLPDSFWPEDAFYSFPSVLARLALPPVGTQLNVPGLGQISLRTGNGGVSGTVTFPNGITINASGSGASVTVPGAGTISIDGSGTISGTTTLPGGYVLNGSSNGQIGISGPGGATITTGPGGTTIAMPGGASITVNGTGAIGVTLPQGAGTLLGNGIDALGRVLGLDLGNGVGTRTKVVPQGGNPDAIVWEESANVDLGNRPPGVYTVGTTSDTRGASEAAPQPAPQNTVWFTLTVRPPGIGLSGPAFIWINDDTDSGDFGTGDVPSPSSPNFSDSVVNGIRDLVDFFPIVLNLRDHVLAMPPGPDVKYKLKHAGGALNFVYTNLTSANAQSFQRQVLSSGFGSSFNQPAGEAPTQQITAAGVELDASFLTRVAHGTGNVILIEGRAQSSAALVLSVERANGATISSIEMPLRISAVETMFRHLDLSTLNSEYDGAPILPSPAAQVSRSGDPGDPYPDVMTNGKYFVFLHGYNVDGRQARGWNCEIFKRLHQMGSRARFVGVTWHGATGLDYHKAVYHSFQTGSVLAAHLSAHGVTGDVTVAAHSLGNMLVSHAIASGGFTPTRYFMINGAVPIEAYNHDQVDETQRGKMVEDDWKTRDARFYAANWHELFESTPADARNSLKWKNRFVSVKPRAYNFYSPGEDVVAEAETATASMLATILRQGFNVGRGAWTAQELIKGVNWTTSLGELFMERKQAGWNARILTYGANPGPEVTNETLKSQPYFERFLEQDLMHPDAVVASAKASVSKVRNDLLARAIPALSYAVAVAELADLGDSRNYNMELDGRQGGWPTDGHSGQNTNRWLHSDFRNVALNYVHPMYLKMIEIGGL